MTNSVLRSRRKAVARLAGKHNVVLTRQSPGTRIYLETTDRSYELTVLDRRSLKIEIVSNDPRLGVRTVGFFERSIYDERGKVSLAARIAEGMRMQIRFVNGVFRSRPVVTATVVGADWRYKVF